MNRLKKLLGNWVFYKELDESEKSIYQLDNLSKEDKDGIYIYELENLSKGSEYIYLLLMIFVEYGQVTKIKFLFTDVYYEYNGVEFELKPFYQIKEYISINDLSNIKIKLNTYRVIREIIKHAYKKRIPIYLREEFVSIINEKVLERWGYQLLEGKSFDKYYIKKVDISLIDVL